MATKITFLTIFCLGVQCGRDAVCFFEKLYKWLSMLSDCPIKENTTMA